MTRPAISYDTDINSTAKVVFFDSSGKVVGNTGDFSTVIARRLCSKPASIKTTPGQKGKWYLPTNYAMSWGSWVAESGATFFSGSGPFYRRYESPVPTTSSLGFNPATFYTVPSWVWNKLEIKALNKLRNQQVNFGVMLAEAGETSELLVNTVNRIARQVADFRRRRPRDFAKAKLTQGTANWRKTPQAWLELQYGWNPLMSDVNASAESLNSQSTRDGNQIIVKSGYAIKESRSYSISNLYFSCDQRVSIKGDCKVKLVYSLRNFVLALLSNLGLVNPAEIVWERVPYSFVVDWFIPVGQWLSALSGDFGFDFQSGHRTTFLSMEDETDGWTAYPSYRQATGPYVHGSARRLVRSTYSSSPWPGLYFKSPVSATHIANALSLLVGSIRR